MRLNPGKNIGHFEILSRLGAGGMGEVYLALDKQLNRKVALKILPPTLAAKQDRMRRFNQEASAAAALNHPHIAHIYEIGRGNDLQFIAMEYIDGETLRNKINLHKTSLTKLLKYLVQVAEGLTKAHAAGIVHRDLKPDNIMITRDDYAKILDFGLAKLLEREKREPWDGSSSEMATALIPQRSLPGMILGTVGYMSPEQAQGHIEEIDHRSDIFAFGCILFEAVTRQKAFEGKDALDSLHKIVHSPTPQIRELNPDAPPELQRIVRRCLAKEPDKRYQSIKDVGLELEEIRQELKVLSDRDYSVQPSSSLGQEQAKTNSGRQLTTQTIPSGTSQSMSSAEYLVNGIKQHKLAALIGVIAFVVGLSFVLYKFIGLNRSTTSARALKTARLTSTGKVNQAAISPDGKYVAYSEKEGNKESLWITQVAGANNAQIVTPIEAQYAGITFSKDSNFIYITRRDKDNPDGALYQLPVFGGNARKVLVNISSPITFSPDGKQIAFMRCRGCIPDQAKAESAIIVTNADGSNERKLAGLSHPDVFSSGGPAWSPDGSTIACGAVHRRDEPHRDVIAIRVSDGFMQPVTSQRWDGAGWRIMPISWLSDNSGILVSGADQGLVSQIWYLSWPGDEARNITNDLNVYFQTSLTADSATLAAVVPNRVINLWTASSLNINGARRITSGADRADGERGLSWSPDGKVVYCSMAGGREEIWMMEADGGGNKQLSSTGQYNIEPAVSPAGRYIVWTSFQSGRPELWRMDIDGANPKLLTRERGTFFQDVSHDGQWVIFTPPPGGVWKVSIDGGTPERVREARANRPTISPDGQFIACNYQDKEGEEFRVAILPLAGGPPIKLLESRSSQAKGVDGFAYLPGSEKLIRWTPDGRAIAYIVTENEVSNIWAQPLDGGPSKQLTDFKSERIFNFAWSRDGQKIALSRGIVNRDVVLITGFK
jgi:eukaryotic-like serine/threonine-protein kinase